MGYENFRNLPDDHFLRFKFWGEFFGCSQNTCRAMIKRDPDFPKPVALSDRIKGEQLGVLRAYIHKKREGTQ